MSASDVFKIPEKLELNSQWVDLHIDQIWDYHLEQDLSLTFGLTLAFC